MDRGRELRDKLHQNPELMPRGCCLVARTGYPLTAQVLTPYRTSHGPRDELFNRTLEQHFQILDRAIGNLKTRFQRLRYLDVGNYDRARAVVLTACVLHNVFVHVGQTIEGQTIEEQPETKDVLTKEVEVDDEGERRRDAVADFLFANVDSGRT